MSLEHLKCKIPNPKRALLNLEHWLDPGLFTVISNPRVLGSKELLASLYLALSSKTDLHLWRLPGQGHRQHPCHVTKPSSQISDHMRPQRRSIYLPCFTFTTFLAVTN